MRLLENIILSLTMKPRISGPLVLDEALFKLFLSLPEDPLSEFESAMPGAKGRGTDHPRYGRWMHAFIKYYKPEIVVEVGTNAGGSAVGTARALSENGHGRLVCIDNGLGRPKSFPDTARKNILKTGLAEDRLELICDDSHSALSGLANRLKGKVGVYLVDAAHTFDAALADIEDGLGMMKPGGMVLVHDVDSRLDLAQEASSDHPMPVLEAFRKVVKGHNYQWCILKFIRKHLGVIIIDGVK